MQKRRAKSLTSAGLYVATPEHRMIRFSVLTTRWPKTLQRCRYLAEIRRLSPQRCNWFSQSGILAAV